MSILLGIIAGCYLFHRFILVVISDIYGQSCFDSSDIFFVWTGCNFFHRMFAQFLGVVISDNWCRAIWLLGQMFLLVMAGYNFFHHMFTQWLEVVILTLDVKLFDSWVKIFLFVMMAGYNFFHHLSTQCLEAVISDKWCPDFSSRDCNFFHYCITRCQCWVLSDSWCYTDMTHQSDALSCDG